MKVLKIFHIRGKQRIFDRIVADQRGSATVEFSLLAIPLFIPLFIFISQFSHSSDAQNSLRTLARESARAFVTSSNDATAFQVANRVALAGGEILGYGVDDGEEIILSVNCESSPCISPDARVQITLKLKSPLNPLVEVSVIEYVSPWA